MHFYARFDKVGVSQTFSLKLQPLFNFALNHYKPQEFPTVVTNNDVICYFYRMTKAYGMAIKTLTELIIFTSNPETSTLLVFSHATRFLSSLSTAELCLQKRERADVTIIINIRFQTLAAKETLQDCLFRRVIFYQNL